jgi:hypothetical protein
MKLKKVRTFLEAGKDPRVDSIFSEIDNFEDNKPDYWINLKEGYICKSMDCSMIHERTVKRCLWLLNNDVIKKHKI